MSHNFFLASDPIILVTPVSGSTVIETINATDRDQDESCRLVHFKLNEQKSGKWNY